MSTYVYLDVAIDNDPVGRVVLELFKDAAPKSTANFVELCKGFTKEGKVITYKGNHFHRVIRNFCIQAGDVVYGNETYSESDQVGLGGCSIFSTESNPQGQFEDENLCELKDSFLLAMANSGEPGTNSSQFFITTVPAPHLANKHTILGKVVFGKSTVRTVEKYKTDKNNLPDKPIVIQDCGEWTEDMGVPVYNTSYDTCGGLDTYEEFPDDDTSFNTDSFADAFNAVTGIKDAGSALFKKQEYQNALYKYKKSLRYVMEFDPEPEVDKDHHFKFKDAKFKLYLNLCLTYIKLKNYQEAINFATFVIDSEAPDSDKTKAFYRRGLAWLEQKRYEQALENFKHAQKLNPADLATEKKIEYVEAILEQNKEKKKKSLAKFFA